MGLKADIWIIQQEANDIIRPFVFAHEQGVISYGLTSYGYDIRCTEEFKLCASDTDLYVDPKRINPRVFNQDLVVHTDDKGARYVIMPPKSFALTRSYEYLKIPRNVHCIVIGKSTYARCGLFLNTTPLEPGWRGYITLEIYNSLPLPIRVYVEEGIGQVLFFEGDTPPNTSYEDKKGKYQDQQMLTLPRVK
jgi:dCTP deaminase